MPLRAQSFILGCFLAATPGCARSHLLAGDEDGGLGDASVDPCRSTFEDCDGTSEDCARAFERGCACGSAPAYRLSRNDELGDDISPLFWAAEQFAISIRDRESRRWTTVFRDASGARVTRQIDDVAIEVQADDTLFGVSGPRRSRIDALSGHVDILSVDLGRAYSAVAAISTDEVVYATSGGPLADPSRYRIGLYRWGAGELSHLTVLESPVRGGGAWDGEQYAALVGRRLFTYDPFRNDVAETAELGVDGHRAELVRTEQGWLAFFQNVRGMSETSIEIVELTPDGTPVGPAQVIDEDAFVFQVAAARHDTQVVLAYRHEIAADTPGPDGTPVRSLVILVPLDERGAPRGAPRVLTSTPSSGPYGFDVIWADYSFAVVYGGLAEDNVGETWLQRICPADLDPSGSRLTR